ncbi:amylo-alpha-1,6-glucosidase [Anaeromyxobacter diazotrophicus]|uniref:Amylo-alpha-1,6-glucosidase n=1 Tax=Anaeromyxobacter diazotrophicus TaxID=2590199 RepID=A0A7I9VNF8_9BACT|nr:glycogen debranching N-terminal domain-containing protein [Anaeromyxobacter diazotrophicus]GEJ57932.1 amylo-alpha-1,6-glucosidase [Anaeromyxobacter diazotrophicus]
MAVTLHEGTTFLVCDDRGDFAPEADGGLFHLDTRFLSRHELRLDGQVPVLLQPSTPHAGEAWHFLTNPPLDGVRRSTLGIAVHRELGDALLETIAVENFSGEAARFTLSVGFDTDFEYILTVKKRAAGGEGSGWAPRVRTAVHGGREVVLELDEGGSPHRTALTFSEAPDELRGREARFRLALGPRGRWRLAVEVAPSLGDRPRPSRPSAAQADAARERRRALGRQMPRLESDHPVLARAFDQASRDLAALRIKAERGGGDDGAGGGEYAIAAGIPWYMDLFGRDSLIASYETMLHDPALARGTLRALARLQGTKVDRVSEEAPGKILHEYRRGPLTPAARELIPTYPYYGTIDATPLYLVTLSEYVRATGDLAFARSAWDHVRAAVEWMRRYGDRDGDGLLEYQRDSEVGLVNQGWKDSTDSVRFRDGRIADAPIALVEVQGYAYDARRRTAELARRLGAADEAERLEEEAAALRRRLRERYWLPDRAFYAEALDGRKRPVDALTSNPGHLLWAGAVDADHARAIARVLLGEELFSGFGVRTMGAREGGYNPVSYHGGSVWPHDNALILAGLVRYGLRDEATRLADALLGALGAFPDAEPPELFCGYPAREYATPVRYPTACRPQAWASGAVALVTRAALGLEVDALEREVAVAPLPLAGMSRLALRGIPAGGGRIDVAVRVRGGGAEAEVTGLPEGWRRVEPRVER